MNIQIMRKLIKKFSIHHDACKRGTKQILILDRSSNSHKLLRIGVLTIYINHSGVEMLHIYSKAIELPWWKKDPLQSISKSTELTKSSRRIAWPQITANVF